MARTDGLIRLLTPGERAIATAVFGTALDLDRVRIRRAKWFMFQPAWTTMAPDGQVWLHPNGAGWCDDFGGRSRSWRALLVHELTHCWQHQQGVNLILRRYPGMRYRYLPFRPGKPFARYNLEQQASIVEDWYWLRDGGAIVGAPAVEVYAALIPFADAARRA